MTKRRIYLDNHATTPVDPRVLEAMLPYFNERFGNPASKSHPFGWEAQNAVDQALGQVAALIGASENEIVFTSGATESINLALKGAAAAYRGKGRHIVTTTIEHRAVLDPCQLLADNGFEITRLDVDRDGILALDDLAAALREDTILVSIIHANNEIGVIQDIEAIGALCRGKGVLLHVDAAQSVGKIPVDVDGMQIDLLSISAHKYYGPKGIGALYVRRRSPRVQLQPQMHGGGHQKGLRAGTLPVPLIVGLGVASSIAWNEMAEEGRRIAQLRDHLIEELTGRLDGVTQNGHPSQRLPGNANLSFTGVDGARLLSALSNLAVSSGSACASEEAGPSHVLRAIGLPGSLAAASLRFGLGRFTTAQEIDCAINEVYQAVNRMRDQRKAP